MINHTLYDIDDLNIASNAWNRTTFFLKHFVFLLIKSKKVIEELHSLKYLKSNWFIIFSSPHKIGTVVFGIKLDIVAVFYYIYSTKLFFPKIFIYIKNIINNDS